MTATGSLTYVPRVFLSGPDAILRGMETFIALPKKKALFDHLFLFVLFCFFVLRVFHTALVTAGSVDALCGFGITEPIFLWCLVVVADLSEGVIILSQQELQIEARSIPIRQNPAKRYAD